MLLKILAAFIFISAIAFTLLVGRPQGEEVPWYGDTKNCGDNFVLKYDKALNTFKCKAGVAPGSVMIMIAGTCGSGYSEVPGLAGRMLIGTVAANGDVGTTGGFDSVTPEGTNNGCTTVRVTKNSGGDAIVCSPQFAPTFTGTTFDNRSAYMKVIFCRKD